MNVIEVDNVSKMFRLGAHTGDLRDRFNALFAREQAAADRKAQEFWALQDISFSVAEGESFGIIGHNGSGKSTLLKIITGIYTPTRGKFKTRGRIAALIEVGAGFHPDLTGRENVYLNGSVLGMKRREIDAKFDEIVAFSELEKFIDTPVKRYSSGMYMRLGFAVAANIDPDIVLVDEVLAVGDESFQKKCMDKMLELRREGKTILFVSHNMDAITSLCQNVLLLSHGVSLALGEPADVISTYRTSVALEQVEKERNHALKLGMEVKEDKPKAVEILDIRLIDSTGHECDTINIGDSVILECTYHAHQKIIDPAFGVAMNRSDGLYIFGPNTKYDNVKVAAIEGIGNFSITYPSIPLSQGVYTFLVAIFRQDDTHNALDARNGPTLTITSRVLSHGVVQLPHTWSVEDVAVKGISEPYVIERTGSAEAVSKEYSSSSAVV